MPNISIAATVFQQENVPPHEVRRLHAPSYLNAVAWSFDGSKLAGLSGMGLNITVWDTKTWKIINEFQNPGSSYAANSLAFLPDDAILTTQKLDFDISKPRYALMQWNGATGGIVRGIPDVPMPQELGVGGAETYTVSKDGTLIAGIGGKIGVMLFDSHSGKLMKAIAVPDVGQYKDNAMSIAFSPDSKMLAVGTANGYVHFFDPVAGSILNTLDAYHTDDYAVNTVAFSPDGQLIAAGKSKRANLPNPNDIGTNIWRIKDKVRLASLAASTWRFQGKDEALTVRTVSWMADNVLAVGDDGSLRLWRVDGDKPQLLLDKKMDHGTFDTTVSPQGLLAATDNNDIVIYQ